jgi:hypothetical protein
MKVTMKKPTIFFLLIMFISSPACQPLAPARAGTRISTCPEIVLGARKLQPQEIPEHLLVTGEKQGGEFDVSQYFNVLTHLSMQKGYALDYVYQNDGLGGYPLLYARSENQAPYASTADIPEDAEWSDFQDYLDVEDTEQGYFDYVVMDILADQFYLFWQANYNDSQIVCNRQQLYEIVAQLNSGELGYARMDPAQQSKIRTLRNIVPVVHLAGNVVVVEIVTFTKWGGFYRFTYTISREVPHTIIDVSQENLVPYDCGVAL